MHMADALLSPAVGGTMWAASAGAIIYCSRKLRQEMDGGKAPLMGVLGAFIFAAQMINFTIPATGSSGHLGGGLLLAVLLGPAAACITIASVLVVQALFFADGGLLALGCNIFNLGVLPACIAYPFIYKPLVGSAPSTTRITVAAMVAAIVGLQLGAFAVVLETVASGISALPLAAFAGLMQPIHLAIGVVEGLVTAAVVSFVYQARPEIIESVQQARLLGQTPLRKVLALFLGAALLTGGFVSWFASENPDGLEWAIAKVTGAEELAGPEQGLHARLAGFQASIAFLPDYTFKQSGQQPENKAGQESSLGSSVAGVVGGLLTLAMALLSGLLLRRRQGKVA
ncbi:MAG: cobalamin biosynthesis protein CbiM [Deltaproteobacteria bacterium]|uniref:energy-coupling factor ABC transporter permease n=1 Tax=Hydrosulfovibrio ferrireducens TaxID=2934181 RepID=UPI0012061957|nr:MAG: cobalamin biosynthesis protein CbiM [Deltaproteobacteria bacterium]